MHGLIVARNVVDRDEIKYFVSNFSPDTPIETLLGVAFSRRGEKENSRKRRKSSRIIRAAIGRRESRTRERLYAD